MAHNTRSVDVDLQISMRKGMKAHVLGLSLGHIFGDNLGRCSLVSLNNYFSSWFGIQQIHSLYGYCL